MRCDEPKGSVVRTVSLVRLTTERLAYYYEKIKPFDVVFNDEVPNDPVTFAQIFVSQGTDGQLVSNGLVWEVDDVGIIQATHITESSTLVHFTFWDRRLRGREELLKEMIRYAFKKYGFQRIETRVALYARPMLVAVERIGFVKEGRLRKCVKYKGEWFDANIYSILRGEALDATVDEDSGTEQSGNTSSRGAGEHPSGDDA